MQDDRAQRAALVSAALSLLARLMPESPRVAAVARGASARILDRELDASGRDAVVRDALRAGADPVIAASIGRLVGQLE